MLSSILTAVGSLLVKIAGHGIVITFIPIARRRNRKNAQRGRRKRK